MIGRITDVTSTRAHYSFFPEIKRRVEGKYLKFYSLDDEQIYCALLRHKNDTVEEDFGCIEGCKFRFGKGLMTIDGFLSMGETFNRITIQLDLV